ncbi:putative mediator of RNA polymerase II transcription subunit 26 isoform X2 [Drosophila navojoa]|uniref:putative mediator of RNA polymerase II transcription subunit 26 isoform X2 n=1 Tax=Drosophila navojoa TaxID=7232 RepID=UPI0011BD4985|nr:putative mediator of RNA polymerase II transcription subunit 26 isoform X2 [Drosophila navojoa]
MAYPQHQQQQQEQQQQKRNAVLILPGKANTSSTITKDSQLKHVNLQSNSNNNMQQKIATTTTALAKSVLDGWTMPQQQQQQQPQRTEDQENAFRQIEDVHNYAKLQHQQQYHHNHHQPQHPHLHSSSSDELEDDEEEDFDDADDDEDDGEGARVDQIAKVHKLRKQSRVNVPNNLNDDDSEEHVEVDVVTVTPTSTAATTVAAVAATATGATTVAAASAVEEQESEQQQLPSKADQDNLRPAHHARRPMNAFLIFCKRHRAIVKERYKSLENRAITKILGDWWAALDEHEKQCFTDLAQQNKDAFFNANPNFKWYKLPAPPLRTLATRPSNAASGHPNEEQQQQQQQQQQQPPLHWQPTEVAHMLRRDLFKFADETQMGELSALLSSNTSNVQDKDYELQQALSETTQFMSAHMPGNNNNNNKRSADSTSNSSEEEDRSAGIPSKKLKSSRSCKGKIYQELFNSGQLAAIAKKSKCRLNSGGSNNSNSNSNSNSITDGNSNTPPISPTTAATAATVTADGQLLQLDGTMRGTSNRHANCDAQEFDLEEKIKELPALSLDAYLQRKRSTKKKKKFSSSKKQRNSNSSSNHSNSTPPAATTAGTATGATATAAAATVGMAAATTAAAAAAAAVGSQKRKARKESITRRDVSAIEQEVASILPLTINGCYYFNQTRAQPATTTAAATVSSAMPTVATAATTTVAASPLSSSSSSTFSAYEQIGYDVTTTSDLLILAEVAAHRTELTKIN